MRRTASISAIVLGILLIVGGVATWFVVADTLADQKIVTSDDACLPGQTVDDPFTAYCQAKVIENHSLEATGGLYYAEMDRDDPARATAATASFLQASLFTSVVSFGLAAMAVLMGVVFILIGLGMRDVERHLPAEVTQPPPAETV